MKSNLLPDNYGSIQKADAAASTGVTMPKTNIINARKKQMVTIM
jgi:hypothetical protein